MSSLAVPVGVTVAAVPVALAAFPAGPLHQAALDLADSLRSSFARDRAAADSSLPLDLAGLMRVVRT